MNDDDIDTVIRSNGLRAEQKLAMAVLKLSLDDIKKALPLQPQAWTKDEDLKSAMKLLINDDENLEFWCMIAGWPTEVVKARAQRIVWGMDVKRKPGRPMQAVVKPGTLYWREWYKRRKMNEV